jgi:bacteriocin biosynthesis cyclodehydratase domain-containing protein
LPTLKDRKPRLPSSYYVLFEPPDSAGDEVLRFISERRRIKLKGHSFREFQEYVMPLLDGRHSLEEIEHAVSDVFRPQDLEAALELLAEHNLLEDGIDAAAAPDEAAALEPQANFFHEVSADPRGAQARLRQATVTVVGVGGVGAPLALALAATRVGTVRCVDALPVTKADTYLAPVFSPADVGSPRVDVIGERIKTAAPQTQVTTNGNPLESDADVADAVRGSDFVVCCVDAAQSSLIYRLNRVCLAEKIRWSSCSATAMEVIVGPTVVPGETPCYMCYKMRAVACADDPEADFAFERWLDRRKQDDSGRRENLNVTAAIASNLLGLEVVKLVSGVMPSPTVGRIVVFDLVDLTVKKHVVLRKPWCPACFAKGHE